MYGPEMLDLFGEFIEIFVTANKQSSLLRAGTPLHAPDCLSDELGHVNLF
jgi:hypothetical protein